MLKFFPITIIKALNLAAAERNCTGAGLAPQIFFTRREIFHCVQIQNKGRYVLCYYASGEKFFFQTSLHLHNNIWRMCTCSKHIEKTFSIPSKHYATICAQNYVYKHITFQNNNKTLLEVE